MNTKQTFSNLFKDYSYWIDTEHSETSFCTDLPRKAGLVIIGSGYTGLNVALETARAGVDTVIIDKVDIGGGCSSKNGGQVSNIIKPSLKKLSYKFGIETAKSLKKESVESVEWLKSFLISENIHCDFNQSGLFHAAHTKSYFEEMSKECDSLYHDEGVEAYSVPIGDMQKEIGSDVYFGGIVYPQHASLNPVKYLNGLVKKAIKAGVKFVSHCEMLNIKGDTKKYTVKTSKGIISARDVVVATNGYTSQSSPWLNKRNIPIGSYVISTEELTEDLVNNLFPSKRHITDSRRMVYYYRASPDYKRVVFGGRVSSNEADVKASGPMLYKEMCRIFPQLQGVEISHSWMGFVSYTFDKLPHVGKHDGIYYSMGYCGSGIALSSYLGMKLGRKVIGLSGGSTAFESIPFPTKPFYNGNPWFLSSLVSFYKFLDRTNINFIR